MNERPARSRFLFSNGKNFQINVVASDWTYRFFHTWKKRYAAPDWTYRFSHTWNDDTRIVIGEKQWTNENLLYGNLVSKSRYVYNKYSLRHRKCGVPGFIHELFVSKTERARYERVRSFDTNNEWIKPRTKHFLWRKLFITHNTRIFIKIVFWTQIRNKNSLTTQI